MMTCTRSITHALTQRHGVNNSIFQVSVSCVLPRPRSVAEEGAGWQQRTEGGGHFLSSLQHLSIPALCLSLACKYLCECLARAGTVSKLSHPNGPHSFCTLHLKEGWSGRTTCFTSPLWFRPPLLSLDDPPRAPEYWPELSPRPAPLTPLCGVGSMARLKVQMIFLHHPPSCLPSELIAHDNIREEHNGDSTNNLPPAMKSPDFWADILIYNSGIQVYICFKNKEIK